MHSLQPGWHMTIHPILFYFGKLIYILSFILLITFLIIKVLKVERDGYLKYLDRSNLLFCVLNALSILIHVFQFVSLDNKAFMGFYAVMFLCAMWFPLFLTQIFWFKKYRVNLNVAISVLLIFHLFLFLDWAYKIVAMLCGIS